MITNVTPNNSPNQFPRTQTTGIFANTKRVSNILRFDYVIVASILSILVLVGCFTIIIVFGFNCDTSGWTSSLITMILTSWLSKIHNVLSVDTKNGGDNRRSSDAVDRIYEVNSRSH